MKNRIVLSIVFVLFLDLFAQTESVFYSFQTTNNKVVELRYSETESLFTYRFLSKGNVELEIRDDLTDCDTVFTVSGYHRGGGVENAAMDYNDVLFSSNGYEYDIYFLWAADEENPTEEYAPDFGVRIRKGEKRSLI